jgi:hypothetical protein
MNKYELIEYKHGLYRIKALRSFDNVKTGALIKKHIKES